MRGVTDLKGHEKLFDLLYGICTEALTRVAGPLTVLRIGKEGCWRSLIKDRFQEVHVVRMRSENTIRKSTFLLFEECHTKRVII